MKQESVSVPEEAPRNDFHFMLVEEDAILLIASPQCRKLYIGLGRELKGRGWFGWLVKCKAIGHWGKEERWGR